MFLDTAISVARNPEDLEANTIFAVRHLAEIAKAFDDTVVDSLIEARRAADQATLTAWKAIAAASTKACCRDFRKLGFLRRIEGRLLDIGPDPDVHRDFPWCGDGSGQGSWFPARFPSPAHGPIWRQGQDEARCCWRRPDRSDSAHRQTDRRSSNAAYIFVTGTESSS